VRKSPYKTWLLAVVLLLTPWAAQAVGLGQLTILSALGQPLSAEVELISVRKDELASLAARLASPEAFSQARIQYSPALVGVRMSIEKRADGRPYIKITSARPVNEPFIDLLIELSWAQGRLTREYTALLDPPGIVPGEPATPVAVVPPSTAEPRPISPVAPAPGIAVAPIETKPAARAPSATRPSREAPAKTEGNEYGPVKRGETLGRIAASVKPEGVTLEQMLVSLYRSNPDAFVGNMNRLKTGRILRVPEKEQVADTTQPAAVKEVRVQAANWNVYRQKLAEAPGVAPAQESKSAARGKITTTVEDKAGSKEPAKEVLKLSKGDTTAAGKAAGGKPMSAQERNRVLEEEATAREKALAEANARIAQLEKTIADMQRLLALKGQVPAVPAKPAVPPPVVKPEITPAPKPEAPKTEQVVKPDPAKAPPATPDPAKMEPAKDAAPAEVVKPEAPKVEPAPPEKPKPIPPRIVQPPPPAPAPDLIDQILGEPLYLAAGAALLALLGVGGYMLMRRRSRPDDDDAATVVKTAPRLDRTVAMPAAAIPAAAGAVEDVDPLAEADLYLNFGRDAQAEEVLKEALQKNPKNEEAQLKLLQIYAGRKEKASFEKVARPLYAQTAGTGDIWLKAAAMGYALDSANSLYEAGKSAPAAAVPMAGVAGAGTDLDFDFEMSPTATTKTEVEFDVSAAQKTMIMEPGVLSDMAATQDSMTETVDITSDSGIARAVAQSQTAPVPDFSLNIPEGTPPAEPDITLDSPTDDVEKTTVSAGPMASAIDFDFDAAAAPAARAADADKGYTHDGTVIMSPENQDKATGLSMDFDLGDTPKTAPAAESKPQGSFTVLPPAPDFTLDIPTDTTRPTPLALDGIDLSLEDPDKTLIMQPPAGGTKDDHWYDVQTKFDLAKAYQEMGDKDGAREILQEVIKEGDAGQNEEARKLLEALG